jgi:hypothetical protein
MLLKFEMFLRKLVFIKEMYSKYRKFVALRASEGYACSLGKLLLTKSHAKWQLRLTVQ